MSAASLSVIISAFNEGANLSPTVDAVLAALTRMVPDYEIIIVNDGSSDGTARIAEALASRHGSVRAVHNDHNMGLGFSYARAAALANKEATVFVPGDNGWPASSLQELFGRIGSADIVMTYSTNPQVRPRLRRIVSRLYTLTLNALFGHHLRYYNGLTVYPTAFLRTHPITTRGFAFMAELLLKALAGGLSYAEVGAPIEERTAGRSKALRVGNVVSVIATVSRLFWNLRIRSNPRTARRASAELSGQ